MSRTKVERTVDENESQLLHTPTPALRVPGSNGLAPTQPTVIEILSQAVQSGVPPEALEKIAALVERFEDRAAEREFNAALAEFQSECPAIPKTSTAEIASNSGRGFSYTFADLNQIAETSGTYLTKHGFSYLWDTTVENGVEYCICRLRHKGGHCITAKSKVPQDMGQLKGFHKEIGALTVARRMSLLLALGITTADPDTEAASLGQPKITEHQAANLTALLDEVCGKDDGRKQGFLDWMRVKRIEDIRAGDHHKAVSELEKARAKQGGK